MPRGKVGLANRQAKETTITEVAARLRSAPASVVLDYRGLTVADDAELRRRLRAAAVDYRVVKNSLVQLAARQAGVLGLDDLLRGPTALAFSLEDPVSAARELAQFVREHQQISLKGGVLEGRVIDPDQVRALAELPSRHALLGRLAGALAGPLAATAAVLGAPLRAFATVTDQLAQAAAG